jgi:signal transduction histidine kinase
MRHGARDLQHSLDAAVPLLVGGIVALGVSIHADSDSRLVALALGLAACAALFLRRRAPGVTLALSGGLVLTLFAIDHKAGAVAVIAPATALFSLALKRGRVHMTIAVIASVAAVVVAETVLAGNHTITLQTAAHVALVAVPLLAAEAVRNRRSYVQLLLERLEQAERTREEEAERRAEQERLRIARDLHDVVAHTLTTINVQAGVAAHLRDRDPSNAEAALATIQDASHDALEELRAILGVLREPNGTTAPLQPAPGLSELEQLIEQARGDGVEVTLEREGVPPDRVPEAVQLAAFRIVQESLTNARRHAPGAGVRVGLSFEPERLLVEIVNDRGSSATGNGDGRGVGILGMRERATALGGAFEAKASGDGFRVLANLPYHLDA